MAEVAGAHGERVRRARELQTGKGRREQQRFAFEGPTLLDEALRSGAQILEIYVTERAYEKYASVREAEGGGSAVFLIDDRTAGRLSSVESETGLLSIAPMRYAPLDRAVQAKLSLVLADLNDPGNAGTLIRSAEAFGAQAVIFGAAGVDPYHPKAVRAAMGALFRVPVVTATPVEFTAAARRAGTAVLGLDMEGEDIRRIERTERTALIVGHERRGLGAWDAVCSRRVAIPMNNAAESLNAAVAGSIALFALGSPS